MKAQTLTPFQIFGNQVRYIVPMFQRPYVWNREDQWEPLWEDLRTVAERILESQGFPPDNPMAAHFLGAVVLDQQLVPAGFIDARHIVDGQQRLTTLQLLLDAAQWVTQHHGDPTDASALGTLVLNNAAIAQAPEDVFKVWPTNFDRAAFQAIMDDALEPREQLAQSRICRAHQFFCDEITEWTDPEGDPDKARSRLHALTLTLTQYLKVVVIDLEPGDNAQVIFETLNHRGTPLLAADLVKNLVFQVASAEGVDVDALYESGWRSFDSDKWRRDVSQGRLYRPRIDVFINYWLVMRCLREVPTDRVYADFRQYVVSTDHSVSHVVAELAEAARVYDALENLPWASVEGTFYYRAQRVMEAYVWGPFLLWLFGQPEAVLSVEQRERALRAIEAWAVRRMLCRFTTKGANQLVLDLLTAIDKADAARAGDFVVEFLGEQTADSRLWPDDATVRNAVLHQPLYKGITRARLRMVLEALEDWFRTPLSEQQHCPRGTLTIEHVMPQGWREHWLVGAEANELEVSAARDTMLHTLGNLTLVNNRMNPTLSNRPWTDAAAKSRGLGDKGKRSLLAEHDTLVLNKQIRDAWPDQWDEKTVVERAARLASGVIEIWPPASGM